MKPVLLLAFLTMVSGCVIHIPLTPTKASSDSAKVSDEVTVRYDKFNATTTIQTPLYLSRRGFTDTFPVQLSYRAMYKDGNPLFIQLYVMVTDVDWGFYDSANGEDGHSFEFIDIDEEVSADLNMVTTKEHFGIVVPMTYLERMATKDWEIKAYGKRKQGIFVVPRSVSKAFLNELKCFESETC